MSGALGEWVNDLAAQFNASQQEYKIVPTYKGQYGESMTAAIAAFRAGNAPHILQVFEVGTATMMASKNAIKPVAEVYLYQEMKKQEQYFIKKLTFQAGNRLGGFARARNSNHEKAYLHDASKSGPWVGKRRTCCPIP